MKCRFCFFEDVVLPTHASLFSRLLRPLCRVAVCTTCATRTWVRGPLLFGPALPRQADTPPAVTEVPFLKPRRTKAPIHGASEISPSHVVQRGAGKLLKRSSQTQSAKPVAERHDSVSFADSRRRPPTPPRPIRSRNTSRVNIHTSGRFTVRSPRPKDEPTD